MVLLPLKGMKISRYGRAFKVDVSGVLGISFLLKQKRHAVQ